MKLTFAHLRSFCVFAILLCVQAAQAQLGNFSLAVMATNESCTANGSLAFSVANTTPGATMLYTVYQLPDTTTPIAVLSVTTYTGLVAGNYRVVATQSLGVESASQQQDVVIVSTIVNLTYQINGIPEICGNDGQIFVIPVTGTAVMHEIIAGPVTRPLQASNAFTSLPAGFYTVRVFDNCGEGVVRTFILDAQNPGVAIAFQEELIDCNTLSVLAFVGNATQSVVKYPVTIQTIVTPPSGPDIIFNHNIPNGGSAGAPYAFTLPALSTGSYAVQTLITDGCGIDYQYENEISMPNLLIGPQLFVNVDGGCNEYKLVIPLVDEINPVTIEFLVSPPGFNPLAFNSNHPGPFNNENAPIVYYNAATPLPAGTYTIQVTDACGRIAQRTATLTYANTGTPLYGSALPGCALGRGSLSVNTSTGIASAQLLSAPVGYPGPFPRDITDFLTDDVLYMGNLLPGAYQIATIDNCNFPGLITVIVVGYERGATEVDLVGSCDSFGVRMSHIDNLPGKSYWVQKYNAANNTWAHPVTGIIGIPSQLNSTNAISIADDGAYHTIQSSGTFRILKVFSVFGDEGTCIETIHEFDYTVGPKIIRVFAVPCENGTYSAIVEAVGFPALIYRITSKNGLPFAINNGNSAIFTGIDPAVYNFQIEDGCGNILNSLFDISNPVLFAVQPLNLCQGQSGSLVVPYFSFLNYQWWKEGAPDDILSSANSLGFPNFNATADAGIYHVRITAPNQQSCVNLVLDFTVSSGLSNPQAGNDVAVNYCGPQGFVDLFSLLPPAADTFGEWEETTSSGALNGYIWNSDLPLPGNYQFTYKVSGLCSLFDESIVSITILPPTQTPNATAEGPFCQSGSLQLFASEIAGASYVWNGPNGFSSTDQNPVIQNLSPSNSGMYSVIALNGSCASGVSTVEVSIAPLPQFTIAAACVDGQFMLTAQSAGSSLDLAQSAFSWSGPENFSTIGNPVNITGNATGTYVLNVSSPEGCATTASIDVGATLCGIPKGVSPNDDGDNDSWNLAGLDVKRVKIFNRYGMLMYEKARYVDEWRGQDAHGCELPSATYYYLIELHSGESKSGWVYLLRRG